MATTTPPPYTITAESITVIWQGKPHTAQKGTNQFHALRDAIFREDWAAVGKNLTSTSSLEQWLGGLGDKYAVNGETILHEGQPLPASIQKRIWALAKSGQSPAPLFAFYARLAKNPSHRSVTQLFEFMEHSHIPLEPDGRFLAYKAVKRNFTDVYTGEVDNRPGTVNKMARNQISDDPRETCHFGFHVGALDYARNFHAEGQMIVCRVDPEHVVCVPYDASHQKMRVCEYEVVGVYNGQPLPSTIVDTARTDDDDDDENDDDDVEVDAVDTAATAYENQDDPDDDVDADDDDVDADDENGADKPRKTPAKKPAAKKPAAKSKSKSKSKSKFTVLDPKDLMLESIEDLRKYAGGTLKIIGASKIPGGKAALVAQILKVR